MNVCKDIVAKSDVTEEREEFNQSQSSAPDLDALLKKVYHYGNQNILCYLILLDNLLRCFNFTPLIFILYKIYSVIEIKVFKIVH